MHWSEAWQRAQRTRCRASRIATVVMVLMMAMWVGIWAVIETKLPPTSRPPVSRGFGIAVMVLPVVFLLLGTAASLCRYRREHLVLKRVPAADGRVCPRCRALLDEGSDRLRCPRGHGAFECTDARGYWEHYPYPNRQRAPIGSGAAGGWSPRWDSIKWTLRNRHWVTAFALVAVWLTTSAGMAVTTPFPFTITAVKSVHMLFLGQAILFMSLGWKRRTGDDLYCAKCDYKRAAGEVQRCPECGSQWTLPGALKRGTPVRSRSMLWSGGLMLFLFVVSYGGPALMDLIGGRTFRSSVTPTWLLFKGVEANQDAGFSSSRTLAALAGRPLTPQQQETLKQLLMNEISEAPRGFVADEWAVLGGLTLTGDQAIQFFERLLEKRDRFLLTRGDRQWMQMQLDAETIPDALRERYNEKPPRP